MKTLLKKKSKQLDKRIITRNASFILMVLLFFSVQTAFSQWDIPGSGTYIQGGGGGPEIEGNDAWLELTGTNNSNSRLGLEFSNNSGAGQVSEAFLHYNMGTNRLLFSPDGVTGNAVFFVDVDNGDTEIGGNAEILGLLDITGGNTALRVDGDEAIWYDGEKFSWGFAGTSNRFADPITIGDSTVPPTNTALVTTNGREIKMVGDNSYIQWHTSTNSDPTGPNSGFIGNNQFGSTFLESNLGTANVDGETGVNFLVSDVIRMVLDESGDVGVGTTNPAYRFQVFGHADITGELTAASDQRLKKNIQGLDNALTTVNMLNPVSYDFRVDEFPDMDLSDRQKMGFIAQELEEVYPSLVSTGGQVTSVTGDSFESKSVNYVELIPVLTKAIQEQQEIINGQKEELALLKEEMASIKSMISASAKVSNAVNVGRD